MSNRPEMIKAALSSEPLRNSIVRRLRGGEQQDSIAFIIWLAGKHVGIRMTSGESAEIVSTVAATLAH